MGAYPHASREMAGQNQRVGKILTRASPHRQFSDDCPNNINDCEQVRRWTRGRPKVIACCAAAVV
jgi:hypothetical protein